LGFDVWVGATLSTPDELGTRSVEVVCHLGAGEEHRVKTDGVAEERINVFDPVFLMEREQQQTARSQQSPLLGEHDGDSVLSSTGPGEESIGHGSEGNELFTLEAPALTPSFARHRVGRYEGPSIEGAS
jgi:hypothetical protein